MGIAPSEIDKVVTEENEVQAKDVGEMTPEEQLFYTMGNITASEALLINHRIELAETCGLPEILEKLEKARREQKGYDETFTKLLLELDGIAIEERSKRKSQVTRIHVHHEFLTKLDKQLLNLEKSLTALNKLLTEHNPQTEFNRKMDENRLANEKAQKQSK